MKIGFIGAGNMGTALARAAAKYKGAEIYISDIDTEKARAAAILLGASYSENIEIARICDYIFLAVKPKFIRGVAEELTPYIKGRDASIVSMAAGVAIKAIEEVCGSDVKIIRIMPNTPVAVGSGIILTAANACGADKLEEFSRVMAGAGHIELLDESLIDAGTALSGCSPAFVYMFIDALAKGGAEAGLPPEMALTHAAKTLIGAATLLLSGNKTPEELRIAVCSPGGSTIEGVHVLENEGLEETVKKAVLTSYKRTCELGK